MVQAKDEVSKATAAEDLTPTNANEEDKINKKAKENRQEEIHEPGWMQTFEDSMCDTILQQSLSRACVPADAQDGGSLPSESTSSITAELILLHSKMVLCDGHRVVEGHRRDAKHLALGDILMEAVHSKAHVQLHFYHTSGIRTTQLDQFCKDASLDIGVTLFDR